MTALVEPARDLGPRGAGAAAPDGGTRLPSGAVESFALTADGLRAGRRIGDGLQSEPRPAAGIDLGAGDDVGFALLLGEDVVLTLRLCAADAGRNEAELVSLLVAAHADTIGIARLADAAEALRDLQFCVGGAAVARRSHKPEVASSNLAPATNDTPESDAQGGGGNLAVPARGADPP